MLRHDYKPKVKALPTAADYHAEQQDYARMIRAVEEMKTAHANQLKSKRKAILAKKAWLIRYQHLANAAPRQSTAASVATALSAEELEKAQREIFNS